VWEVIGKLRAPAGADPQYLLGLPTVYPALVLSVVTLVVASRIEPEQGGTD
jgi:hypothetical protein